jgi:hypothetical protein
MTILLADDDPDDCLLVRDALVAGGVVGSLRTVGDGEEYWFEVVELPEP